MGARSRWRSRPVFGVIVIAVVLSLAVPAFATPGALLWTKRYTGPDTTARFDHGDVANKVAVSPDGTKVFVTGTRYGVPTAPRTPGPGQDYATIAYSASTGSALWTKLYNGPGNFIDIATAIAVSPDGTKVFVTGRSYGVSVGFDYATIAYSASTGAVLWTKRYNGPANLDDEAFALGVSPDGSKVFVTGMSWAHTADGEDYYTVAYGARTGAVVWQKRYNGPDRSRTHGHGDWASALSVSPDGTKVFVTGRGYGLGTQADYETIAYGATTGAVVWTMRYNNAPSNGQDLAAAIAVSPDGKTVIVTGSSETAPVYEYDYLTIAYSAGSGQFLWSARYAPQQMASQPVALVVSPDGTKVFVSGGSYGATGTLKDYATVAYNASTGAPFWTQRYDGNFQDDYATALAVSRDSTMAFVTGWSIAASGGGDYTTIAYSGSTGGVLWTKRYNGPGNGPDYANALAVGPDGRKLFVTGTSYGSATSGYDYATVAYSVR